MVTTHNLGFPRIGAQRELKFGVEAYWNGQSSRETLVALGAQLRARHWAAQAALDFAPVGDFSFYDQVLDMSFTLGNLPARVRDFHGDALDNYFRVARGQSQQVKPAKHAHDGGCACHEVQAGEMTKWFDTNYHYIVPEFDATTTFTADASRLIAQFDEARAVLKPLKPDATNTTAKPVLIGPVTYLWLGKTKDGSNRLDLLPRLLPAYVALLDALAARGAQWVQLDEPALATELDEAWQQAFRTAYDALKTSRVKKLLATYFGPLRENLALACALPVDGLHLDAINARDEIDLAIKLLPAGAVLSVGVVNGRNIWKTDLNATLAWLEPLHQQLGERLWLAPSCSLLHVPVDLRNESRLDPPIRAWLAFALQKLDEVNVLARALNEGRAAVAAELADNAQAQTRGASTIVTNALVQRRLASVTDAMAQRRSPFAQRQRAQHDALQLPLLPTTTIGSFPQTAEIRHARAAYRRHEISALDYLEQMRVQTEHVVRCQEDLGLDVLVHGEAERNDMVEYFGEQLHGFAFTQNGWVQSYGSRCVKPPVIYGDVLRPEPMTVETIRYAQSLTTRPMKGMLTGPVTMLQWSFVRDDQPRATTALQLALAISDEVVDLERAGIRIIQIDEPAFREGLPLHCADWHVYLQWAAHAFRISASGVADTTQIHTHMCYAEFNDILPAIAAMDADVITIETSRSAMELLDGFREFAYPNEIGLGVYDIHSPNIPDVAHIVTLMKKAAERIPVERLWVNPDCGLKTRQWEEVIPALTNMVTAAKALRAELAKK